MRPKLTGSLQTRTRIDFHVNIRLFLSHLLWSLKFDMKSFCFLCPNSHRQPEKSLSHAERYPLPPATQTVMRYFRLACQVQCNWLGRLKKRYHSALLIRMWRGSHVPQFISTSADSLGMADFYKNPPRTWGKDWKVARSQLFSSLWLGPVPILILVLSKCRKEKDVEGYRTNQTLVNVDYKSEEEVVLVVLMASD